MSDSDVSNEYMPSVEEALTPEYLLRNEVLTVIKNGGDAVLNAFSAYCSVNTKLSNQRPLYIAAREALSYLSRKSNNSADPSKPYAVEFRAGSQTGKFNADEQLNGAVERVTDELERYFAKGGKADNVHFIGDEKTTEAIPSEELVGAADPVGFRRKVVRLATARALKRAEQQKVLKVATTRVA